MARCHASPSRVGSFRYRRPAGYLPHITTNPSLVRAHVSDRAYHLLLSGSAPDVGIDDRVAACFVDLARFTTISELLSETGTAGTEMLTKLINDFFEPVIAAAYGAAGDVVGFGGDALTVIFGGHDHLERAIEWAKTVQQIVRSLPPIQVSEQSIALEAKVGVGVGSAATNLAGTTAVKREVTSGSAIEEAARAESNLLPGQIGLAVANSDDIPAATGSAELDRVRLITAPSARTVEHSAPALYEPVKVDEPSRDPLLPCIPAEVLQRTDEYGPTFLDEHRPATVLFVGLDSDQIDEQTLRAIDAAIGIISSRGGTVITLGSGDKGTTVLAAFGAPTARHRQRHEAVEAALELTSLLNCRVGVASGTCFAGLVGSSRRWSYNLMGDPPNTAARLMTHATPRTVLACETTHRGLESDFTLGRRESIALKGKRGTEAVRVVEGISLHPTPRHHLLPLIGREGHLRGAMTLVEQAFQQNKAEVIQILAGSGMGKTRFLRSVVDESLGIAQIVSTDVSRAATGESYGAWLKPIRALLGLSASVGPAELAAAIQQVRLGARRSTILRDLFLGALGTNDTLAGMPAPEATELIDLTIIDTVISLCTGPMLIIVDDADELDDSSRRVLEALCLRMSDHPVAIIVASRSEMTSGATMSGRIELTELDSAEAITLVEAHIAASGRGSSRENAHRIANRVGGSPELLRLVADLQAQLSQDVDLSQDARTLVLSRIDGLNLDVRLPLQMAAILGRHFSQDDFAEVFGADVEIGSLKRLIDERLLEQVDDDLLSFGSPVLRDVTYELLSHADRSRLHGNVGDFLASDPRSRKTRVLEVAHHFFHTNRAAEKRQFFPAAARSARETFATSSAIRWFRESLAVVQQSEQTDLRFELSEVLENDGSLDLALDELEQIETDNAGREAARLAMTARILQLLGNTSESASVLARALDTMPPQPKPTIGETVFEQASVRATMAGDFERAKQDGIAQLGFARAGGDAKRIAAALSNIAAARSILGESERALDGFNSALDLLHPEIDAHLHISIDVDVAMTHFDLGNADKALEVLQQTQQRAEEIGFVRVQTLSHNNAALIHALASPTTAPAWVNLREALRLEMKLRDGLLISATLGIVGLCQMRENNYQAAIGSIGRVLRTARRLRVSFYRHRAYNDLAEAYEALGDAPRADACKSQADRTEDEVTDEEFDFVAPLTDPAESGLDDELVELLRQADELIANIPSN